jgi:hypothetical protein
MVVIGLLISFVARLRPWARIGSGYHALYIQGLVMLYYLTQVALRGATWDCYGISWSVAILAAGASLSLTSRGRQSFRVGGFPLRHRLAVRA